MKEKFEAVVISGGGSKGILSLGALHYYYKKGLYNPDDIKIYAGTSIGSVISLLLVCGYLPMEIFIEIYKTNNFFNATDSNNLWDIFKFMGFLSITGFAKKIEELVVKKIGYVPTMKELNELTGKELIIAVTNITRMDSEYYSHKTKPNLNVIDAIKLSSNLPIVFQRIKYGENYIVDGGMTDNFPLQYIDDGKMNILGIVTLGSDFSLSDDYFTGYFYRLIVIPTNSNTKLRAEAAKNNTEIVFITWNETLLLQFSLKSKQKMRMFSYGYETARIKNEKELLKINIDNYLNKK